MPPTTLNDRQYLEKQYKDSSNVESRILLHQRFSVNKHGWHPWVFDHFDLPTRGRILELGCGPGYLWLDNLDRIPAGWEITLSDFSPGMLEQTRQNLKGRSQFEYKVIDAQSIPLESGYFDAVIANHMLYHLPDMPAALKEIQRVLKPAGCFYTSTVGERHLIEMAELIGRFNHEPATWNRGTDAFTLENGMALLSPWFTEIRLYRYDDCLEVTEAALLVEYILSGRPWIPQERQEQFRDFVSREMESRGGIFHITKDSGLFVSVRKGE
jgi:ubiquinone/menaquinone biosynthesis C-methylase UbiE